MEERFGNQYAEFWINDGILHFIYKPGVFLDIAAAQLIVKDRIKYQRGKNYPILCDTRGIKDTEKQARDFLAKEGSILALAVAFLTNGNVSNAITSFYLVTSKPIIPTEVFTDKYEALKFLAPYRY